MLICAAGDTHGEMVALYDGVSRLEAEIGRRVDLVVHVGDFGAFPDPAHLDEATRKHGDSGEFRELVRAGARVPRPTVFIAGNHEDFGYLGRHRADEIVPDLRFLPWGATFAFEANGERVHIGGVGGCYGPSDYEKALLTGAARRHYCERDVQALIDAKVRLDVLLLHEPPAGVVRELHAPEGFRPRNWRIENRGLAELVATVRPRICFTGHIHGRTERRIEGVRVVGLNKVPRRGSLLVFELDARGEAHDLAELGGAPDAEPKPAEERVGIAERAALLDEIASRLAAWGAEVLGDRPLSRTARKRLHAALAREPQRALLMGVLLGNDARELAARIPEAERAALLASWRAGGLPDATRLQREIGE
jgi:hypothetical protein